MPIITPKSPEVLQAQAAAFAAEYSGYGDGRDLVKEIGSTTVAMEVSFDVPPSEREYVESSREKEYLEFLRQGGGQSNPLIREREDMIKRYEEFAPAVEVLNSELNTAWLNRPDFLGMGRTCGVFRIEHEGQDYAVRIPMEEAFGIDREYVTPAVATKGKPNTEQMIAVSYENGVMISELLPGKAIPEMSAAEMAAVKDEHLEAFVETLAEAHEAGAILDPNPGNVLYDAEAGFSILDFCDRRRLAGISSTELHGVINDGADILIYPVNSVESAGESQITSYEIYEAFIPIIEKYKAVCMARFADDEMLPTIELRLNSKLEGLVNMANFAKETWLASQEAAA